MWDLGCVAASIGFFAVAWGYVEGCWRLGISEAEPLAAGSQQAGAQNGSRDSAPVKAQSREKR